MLFICEYVTMMFCLAFCFVTGSYGDDGIDEFTSRAKASGICVANSQAIPTDADDEYYNAVVRSIGRFGTVKVVVCFCEGLTVQALINATTRLNVAGKYVFFGRWAL
ncbi:hypothetical protein MTO96_033915 [Rhipicephalus appendiculatus]